MEVLKVIREHPTRISIKMIKEKLGRYALDDIVHAIKTLKNKNLIRQDRRDLVSWNHEDATYYTEPRKRTEINWFI